MTSAEDACRRKVQFASRKRARKARNGTNGRRGALHIYVCDVCGWFHLGTLPASVANGTLDKAKFFERVKR